MTPTIAERLRALADEVALLDLVTQPRPPVEPESEPEPMPAPEPAPGPLLPASYTQWDDGTQGVTGFFFNRAGNRQWDKVGGDWFDAAGQKHGPTPFTRATVAGDWVMLDVLPFIERWLAVENDGLVLRSLSADGLYALYHSREHADPTTHPHLELTGDGWQVQCPVTADVTVPALSTASDHGSGASDRITVRTALLRADLPQVPGVPTSAVLRLRVMRRYGGEHEVGTFRVSVPRAFDERGAPVRYGLYREFGGNLAALRADPRVMHAYDWSGDYTNLSVIPWGGRIPQVSPPGGGPIPSTRQQVLGSDGKTWLRLGMPRRTADDAGEGTAFSARLNCAPVPSTLTPIPQEPLGPQSLYFRYSALFEQDWTAVDDSNLQNGKLPGLSGVYGRISRYGGIDYWEGNTFAEGGSVSQGKWLPTHAKRRYAGFSGWAARNGFNSRDQIGQHGNAMAVGAKGESYLYHPDWRESGTGQVVRWPNVRYEPGREYVIEQHIRMNTVSGPYDEYGNGVGANDGALMIWVDGVLVLDRQDFLWRHHPAIAIQSAWITVKNGGTFAPWNEHHMRLGPLIVAHEYIGPN